MRVDAALYVRTIFSLLNNEPWLDFTPTEIALPYDRLPDEARISITFISDATPSAPSKPAKEDDVDVPAEFADRAAKLAELINRTPKDSYEAAHAQLALDAMKVITRRQKLFADGKLQTLPGPSQAAADKSYIDTANKLYAGLKALNDK